jgi:hypothetical protein
MAKESDLLLANNNSTIMKTKISKKILEQQVMLDGLMAFGVMKNGLHVADFQCCEDVEMEPWTGQCKMQAMRDGNVYVTELPKRIRNKAIFRDDNSSLSLGQNGRYYFVFSLPEELVDELPAELVRQASAIAQKVLRDIIF